MLKVMQKKVDEPAKIIEIEDRLEDYQKAVGGYIEVFPLTDDIAIILNEEGKLMGLPVNFIVEFEGPFSPPCETIVGDVLFVRDVGEDFASLTDEQIELLMKRFDEQEVA